MSQADNHRLCRGDYFAGPQIGFVGTRQPVIWTGESVPADTFFLGSGDV